MISHKIASFFAENAMYPANMYEKHILIVGRMVS
jgi:hypothetical protein